MAVKALAGLISESPSRRLTKCFSLTAAKTKRTLSTSGNLYAGKAQQFVFFAGRGNDIEQNVVELPLPSIERGFVASSVGELDILNAPFSIGGIFRKVYVNIVLCTSEALFKWD